MRLTNLMEFKKEDKTLGFLCVECNGRHGASNNQKILDIPQSKKWCPRCKSIKNKKLFYKNRKNIDGYQSICKICNTEYKQNGYR